VGHRYAGEASVDMDISTASLAISAQFILEMRVAAQNREKNSISWWKTEIFIYIDFWPTSRCISV